MTSGILLIEQIEDAQFITEGAGAEKKHYITGVFMQSEAKNRNGRMYPRHILEREVNRYNEEFVKENRAVGELTHPTGPNINLDRVSHKIMELRQSGNDFHGKALVIEDMPCGRMVKALMEAGIKLGVSSRGVGTLRSHGGCNIVEDNYRLAVAADVVHDPSAPAAWVSSLVENKEWIYESGIWKEAELVEAKTEILEAPRADINATMIRLFEEFMGKLTNN